MIHADLRTILVAVALAAVGITPAAAQRSELDRTNADAATRDYAQTGRARPVRSGTYTMIPFGHMQPVLQCAPLRVCTIELEPGETVIDDALADTVRWVVDFATGPNQTPVIVAKPVGLPDGCDLTANLMVTTNRRIYHFTLHSPPCREAAGSSNPDLPYTRQIKFYFPDDHLVRHHQGAEGGAPGEPAAGIASQASMSVSDLSQLHFDYRSTPDRRFPWVPTQVFDNGRQTCIRLPEQAWYSDLPVLYELDGQGNYTFLNYKVENGCIQADRVMLRMVLLLAGGEGGDPIRLLIVRQPSRDQR